MIIAEELTCRPASAYAEKQDVIYCSTTATNSIEILEAIATIFSVTLTGFLAIFAWRAWRTSLDALRVSELESRENSYRYKRTIQLKSLFELLGVYSDLDSNVLTDKATIAVIAGQLRAAEQQFAMVWEYPLFPQGLAAFNDSLLDAAYAALRDDNRRSGNILIYRMLTTAKNRPFRDFYSGKLNGPLALDRALRGLAENYSEAHPEIFTHTLGPYTMAEFNEDL